MEPDILFNKAIDKYNIWYKFIDKEKYNQEAYELFEISKNKYIIKKQFDKVVICLNYMIKCLTSQKNNFESEIELPKIFEQLGDILIKKNLDINKGIEYYNNALNLYIDKGEIKYICKLKEKMADYYKTQNNYTKALELFLELKDLSEDNKYFYNKICKTLFEIYLKLQKYEEAYKLYNNLIINYDINSLISRLALNETIFHALLCYILIDEALIENKLNLYNEINISFDNSRQNKFIKNLINSIHSKDLEMFNNLINDYDSISKFNNIEVNLLLQIKQKLEKDEYSLL